jgi:hypothetical protein
MVNKSDTRRTAEKRERNRMMGDEFQMGTREREVKEKENRRGTPKGKWTRKV